VIRVAILITVLVLLFFIYKRFQSDKAFKLEISVTLLILVGLISFYEYQNTKRRTLITNLLIAFNEGKTLSCHDKDVDKKHFDYESGTMVFISKEIVDIKYPILSCKVKK